MSNPYKYIAYFDRTLSLEASHIAFAFDNARIKNDPDHSMIARGLLLVENSLASQKGGLCADQYLVNRILEQSKQDKRDVIEAAIRWKDDDKYKMVLVEFFIAVSQVAAAVER